MRPVPATIETTDPLPAGRCNAPKPLAAITERKMFQAQVGGWCVKPTGHSGPHVIKVDDIELHW